MVEKSNSSMSSTNESVTFKSPSACHVVVKEEFTPSQKRPGKRPPALPYENPKSVLIITLGYRHKIILVKDI